MPKFVIGVEVELSEGQTASDASTWMAAIISTALQVPNPTPKPPPLPCKGSLAAYNR